MNSPWVLSASVVRGTRLGNTLRLEVTELRRRTSVPLLVASKETLVGETNDSSARERVLLAGEVGVSTDSDYGWNQWSVTSCLICVYLSFLPHSRSFFLWVLFGITLVLASLFPSASLLSIFQSMIRGNFLSVNWKKKTNNRKETREIKGGEVSV